MDVACVDATGVDGRSIRRITIGLGAGMSVWPNRLASEDRGQESGEARSSERGDHLSVWMDAPHPVHDSADRKKM